MLTTILLGTVLAAGQPSDLLLSAPLPEMRIDVIPPAGDAGASEVSPESMNQGVLILEYWLILEEPAWAPDASFDAPASELRPITTNPTI